MAATLGTHEEDAGKGAGAVAGAGAGALGNDIALYELYETGLLPRETE